MEQEQIEQTSEVKEQPKEKGFIFESELNPTPGLFDPTPGMW